tara:strand:- start:4673 stop:5083 length:411 start_codon:yes stop_codon:yes gene_type:complete
MKNTNLLPIVLLVFILNSCQFEKKDPLTPCSKFDQADAHLLALMSEVKSKHKGNPSFIDAFNMEQVYWVQYRDRRLRAIYPKKWDQHYRKKIGKKLFNTCKCQELLRMTERRIEDLQMYLNKEPADQQDCPSKLNE